MPTPLHDEHDKQEYQCHLFSPHDDEAADTEVDTLSDPFDILAQLEEEQGYPIYRS